jgi:DNA-binding MarR family transcriptional regulator
MLNEDSTRMLGKLLYILKRLSYDWYCTKLCHANVNDFNNAHLPIFMSIGTKGISNSKLAANLNITKQAASKVIKELEELKLVRSEKCSTDARSMMLYLTDDGIGFYEHIKNQKVLLEEEYKKVVGAKNYETAINVMLKLIDYHENLNKAVLN